MCDIFQVQTSICSLLTVSGVGSLGGNLFREHMPESVDIGTVVKMTGGPIDPADPTRRITFQIQHRNTSNAEGLRKATEINSLLNNQWNIIPGIPGRVVSVSEAGPSFTDASGLTVFSLNYVVVTTTQR